MTRAKMALVTLALLLFVGLSWAGPDKFQVPQQKIEGAEEPIPFGEVIILRPTPIKDPPKYLDSVSYKWKVLANGKAKSRVKVDSDGSIVFGGSPSQDILAILSVSYLYIVREGDKPDGKILEVATRDSDILTAKVVVKADGDDPAPPPGDGVLPDGQFKLAALANGLALKLPLQPAQRRASCKAVAAAFRSAASSGAASVPAMLLQTRALVAAALAQSGVPRSSWESFNSGLKARLDELGAAGQLQTPAALAVAWGEIAQGLDAAAAAR